MITVLFAYQNLLLSDYQWILVENISQLIDSGGVLLNVIGKIHIEYVLVIMRNDTIMFWIYFLMNYANETDGIRGRVINDL